MADGALARGTDSSGTVDTFTPAQRIAELNKIDQSLADLLASASEAISVLANKQDGVQKTASYHTQEQKFEKVSRNYSATLSAVEVGLKRQVYALEEAGLIQSGDEQDVKKARAVEARFDGISGGGQLDASWLNARADESIEQRMERQILEDAQRFLATESAEAPTT